MMFRRSELAKLGGFWAVRNVLAEDYVIGRSFELAGYEVALSPCLVEVMNDGWTLERFVNRHLRWAQMRRRVAPIAYLGEVLLNPVLWIALALAALTVSTRGPDLRTGAMVIAAVLLKCAADALLWRRLSGRFPPASAIALIPLKDLLVAALWAVGAFRRKVDWRGNVLRIDAGSLLREIPVEAELEAA